MCGGVCAPSCLVAADYPASKDLVAPKTEGEIAAADTWRDPKGNTGNAEGRQLDPSKFRSGRIQRSSREVIDYGLGIDGSQTAAGCLPPRGDHRRTPVQGGGGGETLDTRRVAASQRAGAANVEVEPALFEQEAGKLL